MRGKEYKSGANTIGVGITPAYAGKSYYGVWDSVAKWDHPRVCGEKHPAFSFVRSFLGSPPRMRGKGVERRQNRLVSRITPAYAGKRCFLIAECFFIGDHPRVCGEKTKKIP